VKTGLTGFDLPLHLGNGILGLFIRPNQVDAHFSLLGQIVVDIDPVVDAVLVGGEDLGIDAKALQFRFARVRVFNHQRTLLAGRFPVICNGLDHPGVGAIGQHSAVDDPAEIDLVISFGAAAIIPEVVPIALIVQ